MSHSNTSHSQHDRLTELLSRLPMELRLQIYWLSLPLIRHRKRRVDTIYLADISWAASSETFFDEVGSLVLGDSTLIFHTKLADGSNLVLDFNDTLDRAFSGQTPWTVGLAYTMVKKIKVLIKFPRLFHNKNDLGKRLQQYFRAVRSLSNLEEVQVSLALEEMVQSLDTWRTERYSNEFSFLIELGREITAIHLCFAQSCRVLWQFDRAGMPDIGKRGPQRAEVVSYLEKVNAYIGGLEAEKEAHAKLAMELDDACRRKAIIGEQSSYLEAQNPEMV